MVIHKLSQSVMYSLKIYQADDLHSYAIYREKKCQQK